jgi:hypothetical protein
MRKRHGYTSKLQESGSAIVRDKSRHQRIVSNSTRLAKYEAQVRHLWPHLIVFPCSLKSSKLHFLIES